MRPSSWQTRQIGSALPSVFFKSFKCSCFFFLYIYIYSAFCSPKSVAVVNTLAIQNIKHKNIVRLKLRLIVCSTDSSDKDENLITQSFTPFFLNNLGFSGFKYL